MARSASPKAPQTPPKAAGAKVRSLQDSPLRVWLPTLVVALFIITFVAQPFAIPSGSMENTLLIGDHLVADRVRMSPPAKWAPRILPYRNIEHGDIVIFLATQNDVSLGTTPGEHIVKRVIGVPGDHIKLIHGVVWRNGHPLTEPYVITTGEYDPARDDFPNGGPLMETAPAWAAALPAYVHDGELVVPPGMYFCMGDNRDNSLDSRYWGFVPRANIVGRPSVVYWSYQSTAAQYDATGLGGRLGSLLSEIVHAPFRTRWSRTLHLPK
ncbi:MAG: signal peptidase I [Acidobacteria bacterium]|nr:MAG: signal peptidase I [Acidobacteriota bacterium]